MFHAFAYNEGKIWGQGISCTAIRAAPFEELALG